MARRSLKPQLNQIRTWVREGRTDAWIAHQLEVSVGDIAAFKRDHELAPDEAPGDAGDRLPGPIEEPDLRAEDEALIAAELDAEHDAALDAAAEAEAEEDAEGSDDDEEGAADEASEDGGSGERPRRRRRGRRGGRGRRRGAKQGLEGTFDHGSDGYGLWLDPAIQDDPVYAEHWAGHRPVTVTVEPDRIVIARSGGDDE